MKRLFWITGLLLFVAAGFGRSVWQDFDFYDRQIEVGELLRVDFEMESVITFERALESSDFGNVSGASISGSEFNFMPELQVNSDDERSADGYGEYSFESDFSLMVSVLAIENDILELYGQSRSVIGGENYYLEMEGLCSTRSVNYDYSVDASDIYNLSFSVNPESNSSSMLEASDFLFETNYSRLITNRMVTEEGVTNLLISTNMENFTLEFSGVSEEAKTEMITKYLFLIIDSLFQ